MRCTCPHYNVPSADPFDSRGCPVHDPNYVDPQIEIRELRAKLAKAEGVIKFYADLDYDRWEVRPREYHSMYDTVSEHSDAEKESGAAARAYFEGSDVQPD